MKEIRKEKIKAIFQKSVSYFAIYALLPLICGGILGLFAFIQAAGPAQAETIMAEVGEKSLTTVLGVSVAEEKAQRGLYLLSGEIPFPVHDRIPVAVGTAHYYSPLPFDSEVEERKPEILYDSLPANATPVIRCDLSSSSFYINSTQYTIDLNKTRNSPYPSAVKTTENEPLVLVLHTHGTESYFEDNTNLSDFAQEGVDSYFLESNTSFRTTDPAKSVVQVGKVFSERLNELGISTLHCTVMHDKDDFNSAYINSAETVKRYLAQYPSIQYVIDLHRDAVVRGDAYVKSYTTIQDTPSAQVMLVVGTNQNGRHPNWEQNLVVATSFKDTMDALYPGLSRSLYLRTARFNQEYLPGCMLLEVGSAANSLQEAESAALFAAESFAKMIASVE